MIPDSRAYHPAGTTRDKTYKLQFSDHTIPINTKKEEEKKENLRIDTTLLIIDLLFFFFRKCVQHLLPVRSKHKLQTAQRTPYINNMICIYLFFIVHLRRYASDKAVAFSYGTPAPSTKLAVFDFDGTLINPLVCMGDYCPDAIWSGYVLTYSQYRKTTYDSAFQNSSRLYNARAGVTLPVPSRFGLGSQLPSVCADVCPCTGVRSLIC